VRTPILAGLVVGWLAAIAGGAELLWVYKTTPGRRAEAPSTWPVDSHLARRPGHAALVFLAHPHCPCTRASLDELNTILVTAGGSTDAFVVFVDPAGTEPGWELTDTWTRAHELPGVTVVRDDGGLEATAFHAWTSGQTLLYDADGRLQFNGGITSMRGHEGDNAGRERVLSLLTTGTADAHETAVFGCALNDAESPR
jgi:hypothetical protein